MSIPSIQPFDGNHHTVFRRILPRAPEDRPEHDPPSPVPLKAIALRKRNTMAACEGCRRRRCKCDGQRPACLRCLSSQQECVYFTEPWESPATNMRRKHSELQAEVRRLHESNAALNSLFQALQSREAHEADAILQRIRGGTDVQSILQSMSAGDLLLNLQVCPEPSHDKESIL
ncbi:hypothetical protein FJTKL_05939 [Diaporthe vaccinii]|uniref:Zn(2)-C6 fungal-type domain-containing protein n=1 Tax=Diaporthe vaccinii TaxID=105482 RepID=A0ABR4DR18_9PEZI